MADLARLETALRNADAAGDVEAARQLAQAIKAAQQPQGRSQTSQAVVPEMARDLVAGLVRGAGSIGATLMTPIFKYDEAGNRDPQTFLDRWRENVQKQEAALKNLVGANTESGAFTAGKIGAEIAGTLPVGGLAARGLGAVPGVASRAPSVIDAIRTAGFSAGGRTGAAGLAVRAAGGAVAGGTAAGFINPGDASVGAGIGAALPGALQAGGRIGQAVGQTIRGPQQAPELAAAVQQARQAGYVIPPTQANPTLLNRVMEGMAGKITTAQNASARNQTVTNKLAAQALGLPADTQITPQVLGSLRQQAGQAYDALGQAGTITPSQAYSAALDKIAEPFVKSAQAFPNAKPSPVLDLVDSLRSPQFDAAAAVEKVKQLRTAADDAFRSGNTDVARASRDGAKALEDAIEGHLQKTGSDDLLKQFREARQLIAKTYTVEKALNPVSGSVDARKLGAELKKGKPLSGELKDAASFGLQFPKASQPIEGMGSLPQTSPLDWVPAGALSAATSNPLLMAGVALRPAARAATLSPVVQNRLIQPQRTVNALMAPEIQQLLLRSAPVAGSDR